MKFKNESQRLKSEWSDLYQNNPELFELMMELDIYAMTSFGKEILITMIFRTDEEQAYLYRNSERFKEKPFKSPHQFWHAVDIRSRSFTTQEQKRMVRWINRKFNKPNYYKWTSKVHNVGAGDHFHIQFVKK